MMHKADLNVVEKFANRLRATYPMARIWAFGSRTRGEGTADSDLDLCLVLERIDAEIRSRISEIAWEVGFERDVLISTIVFSDEIFDHGPASASPLVKTIREEGVAA